MADSTLTVLICTHNRVRLLLRTLKHLNAARRPDNREVRILVMVNACNDDTLTQLNRFRAENVDGLPLSWVDEPLAGKSNALNSAIPLVQSDLVAFVDDDHRVDENYLTGICEAAEAYPNADLFCGRILPDWDGTEPQWVHDTGPYRIYPLPVPRFDQGDAPRRLTPEIAIPGGGNLFLRGSWLHKVGPFSTELGPTGHDLGGFEDLDWVLRAQRLGARVQYVPTVIQYHYVDIGRLNLPYLMKKAYVRTASTTGLRKSTEQDRIPLFLYRKLGEYLFFALTAFGNARRRFYLVRTAAALGEMKGYRQKTNIDNTLIEKQN